MSPDDVQAKAVDLLAPVVGDVAAGELIDAVWNLESLTDINALSGIAGGSIT